MFHHDAQTDDIFAQHNETVQNRQIQQVGEYFVLQGVEPLL
jgi:hypothetical protein